MFPDLEHSFSGRSDNKTEKRRGKGDVLLFELRVVTYIPNNILSYPFIYLRMEKINAAQIFRSLNSS